jgi:sec-independent protein translocase protein TatA
MFEGLFQPMHLILILGISLVVFGPSRLPELGSSLGKAIHNFKDSFNQIKTKDALPLEITVDSKDKTD